MSVFDDLLSGPPKPRGPRDCRDCKHFRRGWTSYTDWGTETQGDECETIPTRAQLTSFPFLNTKCTSWNKK